ncbi:4Fe-4S binding protein [Thiovibrio sp. JS02]
MLSKLLDKSSQEETVAEFIPMRCLRHRNRGNTCNRCATACTEGAIRLDTTVRLDLETCNGCLACVAACPTEALEPPGSAYSFRNRLIFEGKSTLTIACLRNSLVSPDLSLACLKGLSDHDLIAIFLLTDGEVDVHLSPCNDCSRGKAMDAWARRVCHLTNRIPDIAKRLRIIRETPARTFREERRSFFSLLGRTTLHSARQFLRAEIDIHSPSQAGKHFPARLRYLQRAARLRPRPETDQGWYTLLFQRLRFNASCNHCGRCLGSCPSGAITIQRDNAPVISQNRDLCCGCGLCVDICPLKAVTLFPEG